MSQVAEVKGHSIYILWLINESYIRIYRFLLEHNIMFVLYVRQILYFVDSVFVYWVAFVNYIAMNVLIILIHIPVSINVCHCIYVMYVLCMCVEV